MSSLGQSSIEYLTSYGWMILAASLAAGALYPTLDRGCQTQIKDNLETGSISVEQAGITKNGSFEVVLDSETRQEVVIESMSLEGDGEKLQIVNPQTISPGGEKIYPIGQVRKTGSCKDYNINIQFDKGPLEGQSVQIKIRGSMNLIETFASLLLETGDSIPEIQVNPSVMPTNETLCIGSGCPTTTGEVRGDKYVNYSTDEMTGTLQTNSIDSMCYGVNCTVKKGDLEGYLTTKDGQMNGTLNVTEIKPISEAEGLTFK